MFFGGDLRLPLDSFRSDLKSPAAITAGTNPSTRRTTRIFMAHAGASKVGNRIEPAWISS
jgi:hypothetical protein